MEQHGVGVLMYPIRLYSSGYNDTSVRMKYDDRYYEEKLSDQHGSFWLACRAGNYPWGAADNRHFITNDNDLQHCYFALVF